MDALWGAVAYLERWSWRTWGQITSCLASLAQHQRDVEMLQQQVDLLEQRVKLLEMESLPQDARALQR